MSRETVSRQTVSHTQPVRDPDTRNTPLMTKRARWLVGLNILIPGSAQVLAGNRRLGRFGLGATLVLWAVIIVAAVLYFASRATLVTIATHVVTLWVAQVGLVFYAVLWVVLTIDALRLARLERAKRAARPALAAIAVLALAATSGLAAYGAVIASSTRSLVADVFSENALPEPTDGRYNFLLLGGDAGEGRLGMRPDSISVVSLDAQTGQLAIIGVPRNLQDAPFSEGSPLWSEFPDGYSCGDDCLISYLNTYGEERPELYPEAGDRGSSPGIEATRDAVEGALGLDIHFYVLVDMAGFEDLIDALGGITIEVGERQPIGGGTNESGGQNPVTGYIEPGVQQMDGYTALWYARSRSASSDYDRMQRQRQVQEAMLRQFDPATVFTSFQQIASAGERLVDTDIPREFAGRLLELGELSRELDVLTLEIVPPEFDPANPDFETIHARVDELLAPPPSESPTPEG